MSGKGGGEARFGIKVESNAKQAGEEGANALEQLRDSMASATDAIKTGNAMLRNLKGSSAEVAKAKADLKTKIDAERNALSQHTLTLIKSGAAYDKTTEKLKKFADAGKKGGADKLAKQNASLKSSLDAAGGSAGELVGTFSSLKDTMFAASGVAELLADPITAVAAVAVAAAAAVVALTVAFTTWVIESGNAARSAQLMRVAFNGNAEDAKRLGNQVDRLAEKLPTAKAEINQMASELTLAGLGGQTLVDTLEAASQASAALGASAGNKVRDFVERSKLSGRFSLGPLETQGLGVSFNDVAASLAKNTKTSVAEARSALLEGRVALGDGAAALKDAMTKRFGSVNLAKMLDLDVLKMKFKETLGMLTKDINLEPLLKMLQEIFGLFDTSTESGAAIKSLVTWLGSGIVDAITSSKPIIKGFFYALLIAALDIGSAFLVLQGQFQDTFGGSSLDSVDLMTDGLTGIKVVAALIAGAVAVLATNLLIVLAAAGAVAFVFYSIYAQVRDLIKGIKEMSEMMASVGGDTGKKLGEGLKGGAPTIQDAGTYLADSLKSGFATVGLKIHSPSKVFEEYGKQSAAGYGRGVDSGGDMARMALDNLVGSKTSGGGGESATHGPVNITVNVTQGQGHGSGHHGESDSDFIARLTNAIELELQKAGLAPA